MTKEMNDKDLHKKFSKYGQNAKEWLRKCALLLPEIAKRKIWKKKGFGSIYEYAAKLAGMSKSSVDDALWVMKKIADKPDLKKIAEEKGINRIKPVANIATAETAKFWAEKASHMSQNTLRTFVRESKKSWVNPKTQPEEMEISMKLKPKIAKKLEQLKKHKDFEELMEEFLDFVEGKEEKPEPAKTNSRHIPAKIKHFVIQKTNGKCAFPACNCNYEILHHTQRFALEKTHDPDKLVPLCKAHEQLAHLGLIENEDGPPETWTIKKEADKTNYKQYIDTFVNLYR